MAIADLNLTNIDDSQFGYEITREYVGIGYSARDGKFYITADFDGDPPKSWKMGEDGSNYVADTLSFSVLAVRKRVIIEDDMGIQHYYPNRTRRTDMAAGKFQRHIQALVKFDGIDEPMILGLKGYTKTVCWDNPAGGPFSQKDFAAGIETQLAAHIKEVYRVHHKMLPPYAWRLTLGSTGKALTVGTGRNTSKALPFEMKGEIAFVGAEALQQHAALYQEHDCEEWAKAWATAAVQDAQPEVEETDLSDIPGFDLD